MHEGGERGGEGGEQASPLPARLAGRTRTAFVLPAKNNVTTEVIL